jgi:Flp pilus assembly protein TadG
MLVPLFCLFLFGMLEFGFLFSHNLTIEYASREGVRTGAALGDGGRIAANCATIDAQIVAAVERVLTSPGSPISEKDITIKLWKSTPASDPNPGTPASAAYTSTWTYVAGGGPTVDGAKLDFVNTTPFSAAWAPCNRNTGNNPDSIGVSIDYTYTMATPLSAIGRFFGGSASGTTIALTDRTVMALNP